MKILNEIKISLVFGIGTSLLMSFGVHYLLIGTSSANNPVILEKTLTASRYLNSAVIGGSSTVLALILTMLSISNSADKKMSESFYLQIQAIAILAAFGLILSTVAMLVTSFPVVQGDKVDGNSFNDLYWSYIGLETVIVGLLISQISVLMQSVWQMIEIVKPSSLSK